jgi:hypothetical protein
MKWLASGDSDTIRKALAQCDAAVCVSIFRIRLGALAATVGPDAEKNEEEEEDEEPIDFVTVSRKVAIAAHILFAGLESNK